MSSTRASVERELLESIALRALAQATCMIDEANHRDDIEPGDPKVGGHPAASASSLHLLGALHLLVREPQDWIASKPHASPTDHAYHHLLGLLREPESGEWMESEAAAEVMSRLRRFPRNGEAVFQSYHAESDPDAQGLLPSGSVGIPAVAALFSALAFRYLEDRGLREPDGAHFWCLIGDSEFREGSLLEALTEASEREVGNLTWILDYNRQSLDGARAPGEAGLRGTDDARIRDLVLAHGWELFEVRHGRRRRAAFRQPGGEALREVLEHGLADTELQALLYRSDGAVTRQRLIAKSPDLERALSGRLDHEVQALLADLGGHDIEAIADAYRESKKDPNRPTFIIAHTVKGWGLPNAAAPGNHSSLLESSEMEALLAQASLTREAPYAVFPTGSAPARWLEKRGAALRSGLDAQRESVRARAADSSAELGSDWPIDFGIDLKLVPTIHTQWMWGQIIAKLIRLGTRADRAAAESARPLNDTEKRWEIAARHLMTLSPDVGTSTQLAYAMDGKVYGPPPAEDHPKSLDAHDPRRPDLTPTREPWARHLRFEITEANAMVALGAFGKLRDLTGVPILPALTIYDFFIKRALDQLYYDLYWGASFLLIGTPSGVTLAPEGAQHSWKSDLQLPNLITWEPAFAIEMEWIFADAVRRHFERDDRGRTGVLVRAVTRSLSQKVLWERLARQRRFKVGGEAGRLSLEEDGDGVPESRLPVVERSQIESALREDVLCGGYLLIDYRGYAGYEPGENVVRILVMGALVLEAVAASDALLDRGIFADVVVVTSADLLLGRLGKGDGHVHLREKLGLAGDLHVKLREVRGEGDAILAAGRRVPIVSVCDGEPGLLDNAGSIAGVRQMALGLERPSKSGRPSDVYRYHGLDGEAIIEACGRVLAETALEEIVIDRDALKTILERADRPRGDWRELWE